MDLSGPSSGNVSMKFIKSKKGNTVLLHAGHRYNFAIENKNGTTNWRCFNRNECTSSITLKANNDIIRESNHTCIPDEKRNKVDELMDECKKEVCINMAPIPKIFEKVMETADCSLEEEEKPLFSEKKDILYKARNKYFNLDKTTCNDLRNLKLPNSLVDDFFLYDDGKEDKIIIFCTPTAKQYLTKIKIHHGDGTFKVVPRLFYQMYSLHVNLSEDDNCVNFVSLIYILLPNKTKATYVRLFTILRDQFSVNIEEYRCDYEVGVIEAVKAVFPGVQIKGCYYHYWKAIVKNSTRIGLNKMEGGNHITKLFMALALLPPILIPEGVLSIQDLMAESEEATKFYNYFETQWLNLITREVFSCYGQKFRTNNPVEGWHGRLNKRLPQKPSIFYFIQLLKKEANFQDRNLKRAAKSCKQKRRCAKLLENDSRIDKIINKALNSEISVIECLQLII